jgi:thioesterase domain-containing protein
VTPEPVVVGGDSAVRLPGGAVLETLGGRGHAAPCLLVHGHAGTRAVFRDLAARLAGRVSAVHVVELPWHGVAADGVRGQDLVAAIAEALATVAGPLVVVGHSAAGHLAACAIAGARRTDARVVALAPVGRLDERERETFLGFASLLASGIPPEFDAALAARWFSAADVPGARATIRAWLAQTNGPRLAAMLRAYTELTAPVTLPPRSVIVLFGADAAVDADNARLLARADTRVHVVAGAHFAFLEDARVADGVVELCVDERAAPPFG